MIYTKKVLLFLLIAFAMSQAYAQYEIKKYTINSGGEKVTGGNYEMTSSIGQVDASSKQTGGSYTLNGGFWHQKDSAPQSELIFTNGFE